MGGNCSLLGRDFIAFPYTYNLCREFLTFSCLIIKKIVESLNGIFFSVKYVRKRLGV